MGQRIEVCRTVSAAHPQAFLSCGFETGIVALALRPQSVSPLKTQTFPVNGKSAVCWNGLILGAALVLLAVVPVFVVTRANTGFGLAERAAVFLASTPVVGRLSVLMHGKACLADRIADRKRFQNFRTARIERDKCLALIDCFYRIVDAFHVVALVGKEGTFFQRNRLIRGCEDVSGNGGVGDIARCGQLIERQPGDAVHQHMAFVNPVELIPPFIVLVGSRMDAQGAVRVCFGLLFRVKFILGKGLGIVLLYICCNECGVQTAEMLVVERSGALGCEQRDIIDDFLSVDSGQPLSGWFSLQANFIKKGLRFLYLTSDFRLQPWPESLHYCVSCVLLMAGY